MTGFIKLHRGFLTTDIFAEEPYTEREAFLYLIISAAWKDRSYRVGNKVIPLKRGQHTASLRYLAEAWKWKKDKVADFLKILQSSDMIQTDTQTGQNVITICNYSKYQDEDNKSQPDDRQMSDTYQTDTRQLPDKTEEGKEGKEGNIIEGAGKSISKKPKRKNSVRTIKTEFKTIKGLPAEYLEYAKQAGFDEDWITVEFRKFYRYFETKGYRRPGWFASWQNWIDNAIQRKTNNGSYTNGAGSEPPSILDITREIISERDRALTR